MKMRYKATDYLFGPDATRLEKGGVLLAALFSGSAVAAFWLCEQPGWPLWVLLVTVAVAADLGGGVVANFLPSCKRFYHQQPSLEALWWEKALLNPLVFSALHIYPILIWAIHSDVQVRVGVLWYLLLLGFTIILRGTPDNLKRPAAGLIVLAVLLLNALALPSPAGLSWFIPALFIKLVLAHQVPPEAALHAD